MTMQRNKRSGKLKDFARSLCFLSPSFLGGFLFFILPFAVVVKYAFTNAAGEPVQFQNIVNLLKNPIFKMAAKNTLTFSAVRKSSSCPFSAANGANIFALSALTASVTSYLHISFALGRERV